MHTKAVKLWFLTMFACQFELAAEEEAQRHITELIDNGWFEKIKFHDVAEFLIGPELCNGKPE